MSTNRTSYKKIIYKYKYESDHLIVTLEKKEKSFTAPVVKLAAFYISQISHIFSCEVFELYQHPLLDAKTEHLPKSGHAKTKSTTKYC